MPSDLLGGIKLSTKCPMLEKHAPALLYLSIMGKYGPFKDSLARRFTAAFDASATSSQSIPQHRIKSMESLKSMAYMLRLRYLKGVAGDDLVDEDVACIIQIAQLSWHDIAEVDLTAWITNVGRGNCFYSGPSCCCHDSSA